MNIRTEIFLALRYFKPKRNAVSVITCISILGVTLGVAVLIVVLSVMTGFTDIMKKKLIDTTAHIQVFNYHDGYISDPAKVIATVKKCGATSTAPIVYLSALIQKDDRFLPKTIIGIDPEVKVSRDKIEKAMQFGSFSLEKNEIIISGVIANELGVVIGDKLLVHAPNKLAKMVKVHKNGKVELNKKADMYLPQEFKITGIFSFGKYDFDKNVLFVNLDDADEIFGLPWGAATAIYVWTEDPFNVSGIVKKMRKQLPGLMVYSWRQMNEKLLGVLAVEKNMMLFLLVFIVLVAAFSITNTLITTVIQKTREIGLLKSLGATAGTILRVFVLQGFLVGFLGTCCGTGLGILVIIWRNQLMHAIGTVTGMELFPKEFYFFDELPASLVPHDLIIISIISIVLCTLGAIIPALRAARLDPAKALRYE